LNVFGLAVVPGYASAIPDLLSQLGPGTFGDLGRMLRLLSVPYALVTDTGASELGRTSTVNLLSHPLPHGSLLRLQDAQPRVYLPSEIRSAPPAEAASHLLDEAVVTGQQVLLLTAGQPLFVPAVQGDEPRACTLESFANTRIVASCSTPSPPWPRSSSSTTRVGAHWSTEKPRPCCGRTCSCGRSPCPRVLIVSSFSTARLVCDWQSSCQ